MTIGEKKKIIALCLNWDFETRRLGLNTLLHCETTNEFKLALLNKLCKTAPECSSSDTRMLLNEFLCKTYDIIENKKLTK